MSDTPSQTNQTQVSNCSFLSDFLRSKRKMLGRRDLGEETQCVPSSSSSSSSTSSPPETPTDAPSCLTRAAGCRNPRSARSESFKALLLRKGSRVTSSSRISAVERLCVGQLPPPGADRQKTPPDQLTAGSSSPAAGEPSPLLTMNLPPLSPCTLSVTFGWRRRDPKYSQLLLTPSSSSPFLLLSSSHLRHRSLAPPCSSSRRLAARCRLFAAPMTAILEAEDEEEAGEVFLESNLVPAFLTETFPEKTV
ncbi:Nance-Horan syndrome protein-like isoform X3 [Fundulus heteroclitus]|uniref:Nance-Horan syndrome protein-like isoform X3 n=1 Tax=Fundulus heteroclitus TaxID=8078 RepID=UPI00165B7B12|nr:Nance-Horan syndrome protein-like isoform X3 [Fundulus heteroclitus]